MSTFGKSGLIRRMWLSETHSTRAPQARRSVAQARSAAIAVALYTAVWLPGNASAQDELLGEIASFWDIPLGLHAEELNPALFGDYACGTNGGPPSLLIGDWTDYATCPAEAETGFHEVQFRYDDEREYWARAVDAGPLILTYAGTKISTIDVIISGLFDDDGFLRGLRAVTDPRVSNEERLRAIAFRNFMLARFDPKAWECEQFPLAEGETPIGQTHRKERCTQTRDGQDLVLVSNYFRKPGQYGVNPANNLAAANLFESSVRFEMFLANPIEDREARLAEIAANPRELTEAELNRETALDCPGCDLSGLDLKRQDLTGANLAGADLSGANLHAAILVQADLTGANLAGANLNTANLRQAEMSGAILTDALLYGATLDGANLMGADLTRAKAQQSRWTRANLTDARVVAVDMREAFLSSVIAVNAYFGGTWLNDAQMRRGDFTGADFLQAIMQRAMITQADLSGASMLGADLIQADMRGSVLTGTDFTGARLTQVIFLDTNIEDALTEDAFDPP